MAALARVCGRLAQQRRESRDEVMKRFYSEDAIGGDYHERTRVNDYGPTKDGLSKHELDHLWRKRTVLATRRNRVLEPRKRSDARSAPRRRIEFSLRNERGDA